MSLFKETVRTPDQPIWYDFDYLGVEGWWPVTQLESELIWQGWLRIAQQHSDSEPGREMLVELINRIMQRLRDEAQHIDVSEPDPEWLASAVLTAQARAWITGQLPRVRFDLAK